MGEPPISNRTTERPQAPLTGHPADSREYPITRDALGRPLVSDDERRRVQALELAVGTFQSAQGLDTVHTQGVIERAKSFERYIAGG